jgi:hypothetical protein
MSLVSLRDKISIDPDGAVEIRVELRGDSNTHLSCCLQCVACEYELLHDLDSKMSICPSCGYEVTDNEASEFAKKNISVIREKFAISDELVKRGFLCRFLGFLKNRKKLLP